MADQPAVLKIKRSIDRPSSSTYEQFVGLPIGNIIDAQGRVGAIDYRIKAITSVNTFVGPIITVDAGPRDNLAPWAALEHVQHGDILMIATGGYSDSSVIGDMFVGMAKNAGVAGIVTDGVVRDREGIDMVGIPVYAMGISSNSPQKNGPGSIGLPVVLGGVSASSGDIACGDSDGVVVVKQDQIAAVVEQLDTVIKKEKAMEAEVNSGKKIPGWFSRLSENLVIKYLD